METNSAALSPDALQTALGQLGILDESLRRILVTIGGIALSYLSVSIQRRQLICTLCPQNPGCEDLPNPKLIQALSSLLVISSLFYFTRLSGEALGQGAAPSQQCTNVIGHTGNQMVLSVALARFADLLRTLCAGDGTAPAQTDVVDIGDEIA